MWRIRKVIDVYASFMLCGGLCASAICTDEHHQNLPLSLVPGWEMEPLHPMAL
jgi:hypothetical protein